MIGGLDGKLIASGRAHKMAFGARSLLERCAQPSYWQPKSLLDNSRADLGSHQFLPSAYHRRRRQLRWLALALALCGRDVHRPMAALKKLGLRASGLGSLANLECGCTCLSSKRARVQHCSIQRECAARAGLLSARSFLPSALSGLMSYYTSSARQVVNWWDANGNPLTQPVQAPALPSEYREVFRDCIRHADPAVAEHLAYILVKLQIHDSRMHEAAASVAAAGGHAPGRYAVLSYLMRLGELYALTSVIFEFARGETTFESRGLEWEDFRNSFGVMEVDCEGIAIDAHTDLRSFTERWIARNRPGGLS